MAATLKNPGSRIVAPLRRMQNGAEREEVRLQQMASSGVMWSGASVATGYQSSSSWATRVGVEVGLGVGSARTMMSCARAGA